MGAGIAAAVPIVIGDVRRTTDFLDGFFENYTFDQKTWIYTMKTDVLVKNYRDFLIEFYAAIGEKIRMETLPDVGTYEEFEAAFNCDVREWRVPYLKSGRSFSCLGGGCKKYWLFYFGSYKAHLEEYTTLEHFERLLPKAISNPLAKLVKFGISS